MGEVVQVPKDDLLDVLELTHTLQQKIYIVLKDSPLYLSMPSLMSATIRCILHQCDNIEQAQYYRDVFMESFDQALKDSDLK